MPDAVIRAEGLGKTYTVRSAGETESYATIRDTLARRVTGFVRSARDRALGRQGGRDRAADAFWALRDVTFEVHPGEIVGVIGRNGAGKSTLLKILSRITEPSAGQVTVRGRVSSLLEVGTGFHPELSGRENIYLNGSILGMTRAEIDRRFDEIVEFSQVGRFIDTPVKRYSSGMSMRLAFAVAAHLEPELLIVDEVLAVGDAEFRAKCLGKMAGVAREGRSVLFVSHNLAAVSRLCPRAILLDRGRIVADGPAARTIADYLRSSEEESTVSFAVDPGRPSISRVGIDRAALAARDLIVDIGFVAPVPLRNPVGGLVLRAEQGEAVWGSNANFHRAVHAGKPVTSGVLRCEARALPLVPGDYTVSVWLSDWHDDFDHKLDILRVRLGEESDGGVGRPDSGVGHLDWPAVWHTLEGPDDGP